MHSLSSSSLPLPGSQFVIVARQRRQSFLGLVRFSSGNQPPSYSSRPHIHPTGLPESITTRGRDRDKQAAGRRSKEAWGWAATLPPCCSPSLPPPPPRRRGSAAPPSVVTGGQQGSHSISNSRPLSFALHCIMATRNRNSLRFLTSLDLIPPFTVCFPGSTSQLRPSIVLQGQASHGHSEKGGKNCFCSSEGPVQQMPLLLLFIIPSVATTPGSLQHPFLVHTVLCYHFLESEISLPVPWYKQVLAAIPWNSLFQTFSQLILQHPLFLGGRVRQRQNGVITSNALDVYYTLPTQVLTNLGV